MTKRDPRECSRPMLRKSERKKHKNQEELTPNGTKHGNADGLSRRPPVDEISAAVRTVTEGTSVQVREAFQQLQLTDTELGDFVWLRLNSDEMPNNEDLTAESEVTKKLVTKWNEFKVREGLVYRETESPKKGETKALRLVMPHSEVNEALFQFHAGSTAGHFGIRKTLDQVQRRFFWNTWKKDTKRFCRK